MSYLHAEKAPFDKLLITPGATRKANMAVSALQELLGKPTEYYAFMLSQPDNPGVVCELYFPGRQSNSGAHTHIPAEEVAIAAREIEGLGYRIAGWCHAHPWFSTNPSGTDAANNRTVLDQLSASNIKVVGESYRRAGNSLEVIVEERDKSRHIRLQTGSTYVPEVSFEIGKGGVWQYLAGFALKKLMTARNLRIKAPNIAGFSFSMVVNGVQGQEHAEVSYVTNCGFCDATPSYSCAELPLEVLETGNDAGISSDALMESLREELSRKVGGIK